jgi:hypothetical protein
MVPDRAVRLQAFARTGGHPRNHYSRYRPLNPMIMIHQAVPPAGAEGICRPVQINLVQLGTF